ncbi:MAG: hypothetical protein OZ921_00385 [Sorangiineae bacterium]|nr:hypothetical protein [Polyangiaceae bacterium]MEB2320941.1 hypothetical protein [Sorangiineae bacterium]
MTFLRPASLLALTLALSALGAACGGGSDDGDSTPNRDAGADVTGDAGADATADGDAAPPDAPSDATAEHDAGDATTEGGACTSATIDLTPSADEHQAIKDAVDAFQTANPGVTVTLDGAAEAVASITGEFPVTLDASIVDPCARALAGLKELFAKNATLFRLPADLTLRVCNYDNLLDAEILRLHGGTYYDGRPLVGAPTELLVHVKRDGHVRYFVGGYLPVPSGAALTPCLDAAGAAKAAIGATLDYTRFKSCVLQGPGSITLEPDDDYVPLGTGVFVDPSERLHFVRLVDAFLAPSRVNPETGNTTLYCCSTTSTQNCVGKTLVIDELSGEVLAQLERCHTC